MTRARLHHIYDKALLWLMLAFFVAHMVNHLVIYAGAEAHIAFMEALRTVYRFPALEVLLIWGIARQVWAGIKQMRRFGPLKSKGRFRVLVWSGLYLIFFMGIHLSAVAGGRYGLGLDTNLYFGVSGFQVWPFIYWFYPYYFLAIFTAFAHWGAVGWLRSRAENPVRADLYYRAGMGGGLFLALLIILGISGTLVPIDIPADYLAAYP